MKNQYVLKKLLKIQKQLSSEDGYITFVAAILVGIIIMYNIVVFTPLFFVHNDMNKLAETVVEDVEYNGRVDSNTYALVEKTIDDLGLRDNVINYEFSGDIRPSGKIQLRDSFKFSVKGKSNVKLVNFFIKNISMDFDVNKTAIGRSEVYYKPGEI